MGYETEPLKLCNNKRGTSVFVSIPYHIRTTTAAFQHTLNTNTISTTATGVNL
jgi:hypothetical protein